MSEPLRKCLDCGLETNKYEELELFVRNKHYLHGRRNRCKACDIEKNSLNRRYSFMISRCYKETHPYFEYYGGRGITVCEEWRNNRQTFIDWAMANGFKHELTLDRIDNDGPYSPENCRWTTKSQQQLNRRDTSTFLDKGTRRCSKCGIEKPFTDFYRAKRKGSYGYGHYCKKCKREMNAH